ncbi:MAG TPA: ATP-grasp domain-containing protein [Fibrobacteria bacterium]|nr:ATP-grasp domain-containing protein [Fibrobacteria bacterium]HOX52640.1 ATP-grasp domain-containing protein [Fibrobacteria bacterium]
MSKIKIWLNKGFASAWHLSRSIREADRAGMFSLLVSHDDERFPAFEFADECFRDFSTADSDAYALWALEVCRRRKVDFFWPTRGCRAVARIRDRFEEIGTRLMVCAQAETLDLLDHKGQFLDSLAGTGLPLGGYRRVSDLAGFREAVRELSSEGGRVCIKPCKGIYGQGFRILGGSEDLDHSHRSNASELEAIEDVFAQPEVAEHLVMTYLPGPEYSVDCLAHRGKLVCCTIRRKGKATRSWQYVCDDPGLHHQVSVLAERFRLDGQFNAQFRSLDGVPVVLEINARPSGGIRYTLAAGVAYPYWALRLALGADPSTVPTPRTDFWVGEVREAVVLDRLAEEP